MLRYFLAILLLASPGLYAKHKKRDDDRAVLFRTEHQRIIYDYYRAYPAALPPGLAKRGGDLPPGIAKQLRRKGHLPPGLEKRLVFFPVELERRLPPLPPYYRRCFIGDRAIVYDQRTGGILDSLTVVINIRK
jgi:hypothetical protein